MKSAKESTCLIVYFCLFGLILLGAGCGERRNKNSKDEKAVLVINRLHLTESDIREEFKTRVVMPYAAETPAGKDPEWLTQLIDREILVQEAQRLGLDREQEFMRTIERFWKQALIKQLVNRKGREINAGLHIYEPKIEAYYKKLSAEKGGLIEPLSVLRKEIVRALEEETADKAMEQWMSELREKAKISSDAEVLQRVQQS